MLKAAHSSRKMQEQQYVLLYRRAELDCLGVVRLILLCTYRGLCNRLRHGLRADLDLDTVILSCMLGLSMLGVTLVYTSTFRTAMA